MKIIKTNEYKTMKDPTPPGQPFTKIVTGADQAKAMEGIFMVFPPVRPGHYHYHAKREGIFLILSGKVTAIIEGKEYPVEAGDIIYMPAGEKHTLTNTSGEEARVMEFYTNPPHECDWVGVKEEKP